MPEHIRIHGPAPRTDALYAVRQARVDEALQAMAVRRRIDSALGDIEQRHADDDADPPGDLFELAASLLREHGFEGAIEQVLSGRVPGFPGVSNGHHPAERGHEWPSIEYSPHEGRVLSVR